MKGADLGKPPVAWSINRSGEMIKGGKSTMILDLTNGNCQANIWLEKSFQLESNQRYTVQVIYDFASADSIANPWQLIIGAASSQFTGSSDLVYQGDTATGADSPPGFQ